MYFDLRARQQKRIAALKKSVLLLGARQTGKSTLMRALNPRLVINLADESSYLQHAKDAEVSVASGAGGFGTMAGGAGRSSHSKPTRTNFPRAIGNDSNGLE